MPITHSHHIPAYGHELRDHVARAFKHRSEAMAQPAGDHHLNPQFEPEMNIREFRPAAVLVPIFDRDEAQEGTILLTQRTEHLSSHSGQVAFPGGKIDQGETAIEAALREAEEEIGLKRTQLTVLGQLGDYFSGSGYRISPVLAHVAGDPDLIINEDEVDSAFEVPARILLDPNSYNTESREWQGIERYFYSMHFRDEGVSPPVDRRIWGVTAGIIRMIHDRILL